MNVAGTLVNFVTLSALTVIFLVVLSAMVRRILGAQVGLVRIVLAGLFGLAAEIGFESQFIRGQQEYTAALIPVQFGIIILGALGFLLVAELLVPPGTITRPDQWLPTIKGRASRTRRYVQITRIALHRGLLPFRPNQDASPAGAAERQRQAKALRLAFEDAGGAFVKLGQVLSTRSDLLPREFVSELSNLQQRVEPVPWEQVRELLEHELKVPVSDVFRTFEPEPLAAASIGQVHQAMLLTGEAVAVKVQRPGIIPLVERDIDITLRTARRLQRSTTWGRSLGVLALAEGFAANLRDEVDYRVEAANMAAMSHTQAKHPRAERVGIPRHYPALSTKRVLVMEMVVGRTLSDASALAAFGDAERRAQAKLLLHSVLVQIIDDGVFHADLHPGNIMLTADGVTLLDFGSLGRLDSELRKQIGDLLLAFYRNDSHAFADALLSSVTLPADLDESDIRRQLGVFMATKLGPGASVDVTVFTELVRLLADNELAVPGELAGTLRAVGTLEGTLRQLSPGFNLLAEAAAFAKARIVDASRPSSVVEAIEQELTTLAPLLRRAPQRLDRIVTSLADGRLNVNVRLLADQRDRSLLRELVNQVVVAFLAGVFGVMAAMLLISNGGAQLTPTLSLFQVFGYLVGMVSGLLTMKVLFDVFRLRRSS